MWVHSKKLDTQLLAIAGAGNLLGEEDVVKDDGDEGEVKDVPLYQSSAKCVSKTAKLLSIRREEFLKLKTHGFTWR
jgi:hypothetical protein